MQLRFILMSILTIGLLFAEETKIGDGAYRDFFHFIDAEKIHSVIEVGSRDALDALEMSRYFQCPVYAFECNPTAIDICRKNIGNNPNVILIPFGVMDKSGRMPFYHCPQSDYLGASSFFRFNPDGPLKQSLIHRWIWQDEIQVETIRLDEFFEREGLQGVDLLCLDVQGAAYQVIRSLGKYLPSVKYIITELEQDHVIYKGEVLFEEVDRYLEEQGFSRVSESLKDKNWGDVLYKNNQVN